MNTVYNNLLCSTGVRTVRTVSLTRNRFKIMLPLQYITVLC